jgi:hypothetical protein
MHRLSAGVAICLVTAMTVGCATGCAEAAASHSGSAPRTSAATPGCRGAASAGPAGKTLTITLAGNDKTYCVQVGDKLLLYLRGTDANPWQPPLVSGSALTPIRGAVPALANGITASYVAVRPGEAGVTSVRPPCHAVFPPMKGDLHPGSVPKLYPIRDCPKGYLFTASIIVLR